MADRYNHEQFTIEDVMHYSVYADCYPGLAALRTVWDRFRRFGDAQPPFPQTEWLATWQESGA